MSRPLRLTCLTLALLGLAPALPADPATKTLDIDFGRDVASRDLQGLATRSDGRILPGPVFTDFDGPRLGEILWMLRPAGPGRFVVGTGPDGKVLEVTLPAAGDSYQVRPLAAVGETHAMSVLPLPDGRLLVGTSPAAALYLFHDGRTVARVALPADSVFDLVALPDGAVLAATGNPGRLYRIDLGPFARAGVSDAKAADPAALPGAGVTVFGEIRDRNVRRLAVLADGRVVAGSSPRGNVYAFPAAGGAPVILQENRDAEVVDLLPADDGGFYAGLVFTTADTPRIVRPPDGKEDNKDKERIEPRPAFVGRSSVVRFPADGLPETVVGKAGVALYRVARHNGWLLLTAGEQGDAFAYDPLARRNVTFAGSASAQLNDLATLGEGRYLLLRNNAPGLAVLTFASARKRALETKRLDLGQPAELGALRFPRLQGLAASALKVEARVNLGSDEIEGWTPWTELIRRDDAYFAAGLRGRYVRLRLTIASDARDFQIDKATLHSLPQNRRPALADFRLFPPGLGLIPAPEPAAPATSTLGQLLFPNPRDAKDDSGEKRRSAFLASQVVPQPGTQLVYWSVTDPDGDNLAYTFSIKPAAGADWTDLAVNLADNFLQFEVGGLAEGYYHTRLAVTEQAPRPAAARLGYVFETDTLLVDRSPPTINVARHERRGGLLLVTVAGRDTLSLLAGADFVLNTGRRASVTQPADGILDGREETFGFEIPEAAAAGASSVEIILYDQAGNAASTRLDLK
ncbi:MAG: hypothetical protein JNG83_03615 [Opitutaceae bacterium]|nr:hypothetical protein [Opitutaceae bacterium]